jgi:hypothetical protein
MGYRSEKCTRRCSSVPRGAVREVRRGRGLTLPVAEGRSVPVRSSISTRRSRRISFLGFPLLAIGLPLLLLLATPGTAGAILPFAEDPGPGPTDGDRIQAALERTDQVLSRADETMRTCDSPRGTALLQEARSLQKDAWRKYALSTPGSGDLVLRMTLKARDLAVQAIETCQVEFKAREALRTLLDSTDELAREAEGVISKAPNPEARRLYEAGLWQLEQARSAYRANEYRKAISLGGAARNLLQRAIQRAAAISVSSDAARMQTMLDRTELLLAEILATPGAADDPKVSALLDRARKEQDLARTLYDEGHPEAALNHSLKARSTALDALWLLQRTPQADRVRAACDLVDALIQDATSEIRESGSEGAILLLDKSNEALDSARRLLAQGELKEAATAARLADSLLRRAIEKSGRR